MGLRFPDDLAEWHRWQGRQHRLRRLRSRVTHANSPVIELHAVQRGTSPRVMVGLDSRSSSTVASLNGLLREITDITVVSSVHSDDDLRELLRIPGGEQLLSADPYELPMSVRATVASGHYLAAGGALWRMASSRGIPYVVVQHGLMTPFAPPLPPAAHLLAFSDADARFWKSGREDVAHHVVGSELLWDAAEAPAASALGDDRPVFLGQLHGAELSRARMTVATTMFWRETGCVYRPHPSETDALSRVQHRLWQAAGMTIDTTRAPLTSLHSPVVAAFSTGVLEAAARGLPAWVSFPRPPRWLAEFWDRYEMSRWGAASPTPVPIQPATEPSRNIAESVREIAEGAR